MPPFLGRKANTQQGALCKWGMTFLLQLFANPSYSFSLTNNNEQLNKQ
jgi:hypothetical protein